MAIDGSPLAKCGLSRPPLTAIPNPNPGTCKMHHLLMHVNLNKIASVKTSHTLENLCGLFN